MEEMKPFGKEQIIRQFLEEMFGTSLKKRKLVIGQDFNKKPQIHEFDLVSDDMSTVGEIKSGRKSRGNYVGALSDCLLLAKVKAKKKLLILTNKEFYGYFKMNSEGVISTSIQVMLLCPEDLVPKKAVLT